MAINVCDYFVFSYCNGASSRGYSCVIGPEVLLKNKAGESPSEIMSNLRGCRFAFADDFSATDSTPLCGTLLRRMSGGNKLTAARKNKGQVDYDPNFATNLLLNEMQPIEPKPSEPDLRRATPITFTLSYKAEDKFDEGDPTHRRKKASIKREFAAFMPEFMQWMRCMVPSTRVIDSTNLMPQPESIKAARRELKEVHQASNPGLEQWISELTCKDPAIPTSAASVRAAAKQMFHVTDTVLTVAFGKGGLVETTVKRGGKQARAYVNKTKQPMSLA